MEVGKLVILENVEFIYFFLQSSDSKPVYRGTLMARDNFGELQFQKKNLKKTKNIRFCKENLTELC